MPARIGGVPPFGDLFAGGNCGIDLFFVLSGFIIATVHAGDIGRPERISNYLFNRIARIYPAVWIMTVFALVLYAGSFGGSEKASKLLPWPVTASFLLLPQSGDALVNVTWTLKYEIAFYAMFAVMIAHRYLGLLLIGLWQTAVLVAWFAQVPSDIGTFYLRPICLEFGVGLACAWCLRQPFGRRLRLPWIALWAVGLGAFAVGGFVHPAAASWAGVACALGAGAIIAGMVRLEEFGILRVQPVLVALGGASYSIYLVHYAVITLLAIGLTRLHVHGSSGWALVVAAGGVTSGVAFNYLVDQPVQRWLRARKDLWVGSALSTQPATGD